MNTNKKYWKLLIIDNQLYFGVETTSARAAEDYIKNHLPIKAVKSALLSAGYDLLDVYESVEKLLYRYNFVKYNNLLITKL